MRQVRAVVSGRVQGVGFRDWTFREATARHLKGWVRNRRDGTVEAVFAGDDADIDTMLLALRQGPPSARVRTVDLSTATEAVEDRFEVHDTA